MRAGCNSAFPLASSTARAKEAVVQAARVRRQLPAGLASVSRSATWKCAADGRRGVDASAVEAADSCRQSGPHAGLLLMLYGGVAVRVSPPNVRASAASSCSVSMVPSGRPEADGLTLGVAETGLML